MIEGLTVPFLSSYSLRILYRKFVINTIYPTCQGTNQTFKLS
jgi:hypothetical protein